MKVNLLRDDVKKTFFILLASAIGSSVISTLYSTVDMICVGRYCKHIGTAALSCINPMWPLMISVGYMAGVGGSVMMANRRGAGDRGTGNQYFTLSVMFALVWSVTVFVAMTVFDDELLIFFGAKDPEILACAKEYLKSIAIISPTFTMCGCLAAFMRNDGEAVVPVVGTVIGGVTNIILDIFLVFDFGMGMGMAGAGLATSIGQTVAFLIILSYYFRKKCNVKLSFPTKIPRKLWSIVTVGFSAFLLEVSFGAVTTVFNNLISENLTSTHLAVFGTVSTVVVLFCCLFNGVGTALQPIAASNFGAGAHTRVKKALVISIVAAVVLGLGFFAVLTLFPEFILQTYIDVSENPKILEIGPDILRVYGAALPVTGITVVSTFYFQSVLKQHMSVTLSLLRGLILPYLFVCLLPSFFGGNYDVIWWSIPITEFVTFAVAVICLFGISSPRRRARGKSKRESEIDSVG